jgi:hypothetical protein
VNAAKILPPVFAGMTLVLLTTNAVPAGRQRQRLKEEEQRLEAALQLEHERGRTLRAELEALQHDPFVLERWLVETWKGVPQGAIPYEQIGNKAAEDDDDALAE